MMRVHASGHTDVGRVREANEDAYHVGDSVFAVADGMGGHLAGEVASSTALEPIAELDGRVFADAAEARGRPAHAVARRQPGRRRPRPPTTPSSRAWARR